MTSERCSVPHIVGLHLAAHRTLEAAAPPLDCALGDDGLASSAQISGSVRLEEPQ
jgi:hypothetical protein